MNAPRRTVVLIVDDDLEFLLAMRAALSGQACEVFVAQQPQGALWFLERRPFDVLLCDLNLINDDGRYLLALVRERWPSVARILVTGFGARVNEVTTFPAAQAVLVKPIDIGHLLSLIKFLPSSCRRSTGSVG